MSLHNGTGRAADPIVSAIEGRIRAGQFKDGEPLPSERELMEEFGSSRTVVREAVRVLASKGVIEARPRYRPVVRAPGFDTALDVMSSVVTHLLSQPGGVKNLFDTRVMIESALVREAAIKADKNDMAALKSALDANGAAIEDSDLFYQTDMDFHAVLYVIPSNPVLTALHKAYVNWLRPKWSQMPRLPERNRENHLAHKAIFEAIQMRDPDAAERALRAHLGDAWDQVRKSFGNI